MITQQASINGVDLSGLTGGSGQLVLLLHGIPANSSLWDHVAHQLSESGYQVFAPDLPGYGATSFESSFHPSLLNIADLLAQWLRAEIQKSAWVVGHDIGGGVAQLLATRHPAVVERLTLANCIVEDHWPVRKIARLRRVARLGLYPAAARMGLVASRTSTNSLRTAFGTQQPLEGQRLEKTFFDGKVTTPVGRRAFARHLAALDPSELLEHSPLLKRLDMPTQVLWAKRDRFQSWNPIGKRLVELLPDPTVSFLPEAGHFSPLETPRAFTDSLLSFASAR